MSMNKYLLVPHKIVSSGAAVTSALKSQTNKTNNMGAIVLGGGGGGGGNFELTFCSFISLTETKPGHLKTS